MPRKRTPAPYFRQRESNPNWRGGRSIASNGYVLIRVGVGHPLADVRGYAYEHRIVASRMLGRLIDETELVHHKNGDKADNRPENLEVLASSAEHHLRHRVAGSKLRVPGEDNPDVACACGCGAIFPRYDESGRPRVFVSGHNPQESPKTEAVLAALERGARTNREVAEFTGLDLGPVKTMLSKLKKQGRVIHLRYGRWAGKGGVTHG